MEPKRIMLVDDSSTMRLVIRKLVQIDSNLVITGSAENGKDAFEQLAQAEPDLILLDLEMPEMDGLDFLRLARPKTKAKVVVLSSIASAGSLKAAQAFSLGADAVVSKPSGSVSFDLAQARGSELFGVIYRLLDMGAPVLA